MKNLLTFIFLLVSIIAFSQNNGINFQGVGRNASGAVLATQKISLRFSVIQGSETGSVEYIESKEVTTNAQGIFSVVIGDGSQISKIGNFSDINWKINPKFLKVEMDPAGGSSFAAMGTTRLQSVPFAYYANGVNAENVDGVLSASKGGTGVASIAALKTTLGIDQINNTNDLAKPISTATQAALDTKISTTTFSNTIATKANISDLELKANISDVTLKAPLESPSFSGTVSGITKAMVGLSNVDNTTDLAKPISTATQAALDTKVSTTTFSTTIATKANTSDLSQLAPLNSPSFSGIVSGITKAMVGLSNAENTADLTKPISTATQAALDSKVSTAIFTSTISTKENSANKSTATDLGGNTPSDILYPTQKAVKEYITANTGRSRIVDGEITTLKLADTSVIFQKIQLIPSNTILGNTNSTTSTIQAINTTGTNNVVLSNSPSLITPNIGDAIASSINNVSINALNGTASVTIRGEALVRGINNGDDAPNVRYENLLSNGIVSLTTDQPIDGQKTFQNNVNMGNIGGVVNPNSPTTINFANGSKIGDIQNITAGNPDVAGSIDLYAPNNAKWVQLNYDNTNFMGLNADTSIILVKDKLWTFNPDGSTMFPNNTILSPKDASKLAMTYYMGDPTEHNNYFNSGLRLDPLGASISVNYSSPNDSKNWQWNFNNNGTTEIPGFLNFVNHSITNTSIISNGPKFKILTRAGTEDDINDEGEIISGGIELSYADQSFVSVTKDQVKLGAIDNDNYWSNITTSGKTIDFSIFDPSFQSKNWNFNGVNGTSRFPGPIKIEQSITDNAGLRIIAPHGNTNGATIEFKSNYNNESPTMSGLFQLDGDGAMVFRTHQNDLYFDNFGNNSINFRIGEPSLDQNGDPILDSNGYPTMNSIATTMQLKSNGNVEIAGDLKLGDIIYSNEGGATGDVLTYDGNGHAIWQTIPVSNGNIGGITSLNNLNESSQSLVTGTDGNDFSISSVSGVHTFNLPDASITNRGLLTSADFIRFNNKQDALDYATDSRGGYLRSVDFNIFKGKQDALNNPITGTGTNGQLSFFNSSNSISSNSDLFWDTTNKRLGIRNSNPNYPLEINQGTDNYGFMLNAPSGNSWGSTIGFQSNVGNGTNTKNGLFQLDGDGAMVFRTYQNQMYFDDFDVNGIINFRIGGEYGTKRGMSFNKDGNLYVDGIVTSSGTPLTSDVRLKKNIKSLSNSIAVIQRLNPVSYEKKLTLESKDYTIQENGFIAQDLQKVLPSLVKESTDQEKILSVNYTAIIPILTKGIQEQQEMIESLKKEIADLKHLIQNKKP